MKPSVGAKRPGTSQELVGFFPNRRPTRGFFLFDKEFVSRRTLFLVALLRVLMAAG